MPPIRNGIADYARALTDALSGAYDCDIRESEEAAGAAIPPGARALHQIGTNHHLEQPEYASRCQ